ncbi:MAG TPA: hydroxyacid dehydrogenase [Tepidisphaeraceae bacterium]|jgi:phosphoglycerate dehydrogenase-like enzyme|nr:hydroxyacid dehydrogenase [Tepidisphaeraceae bacterium]
MKRIQGLYVLDEDALAMAYGPDERRDIAQHVEFVGPPQTKQSISQNPGILRDVEVIFSGWGAPLMDERFLNDTPNLNAVFYAAGAVGSWVTESIWDRGIRVSSAYEANAVPVAEYTLAVIILSLKHTWSLTRLTRQTRSFPDRNGAPGCYGSTIGLISLGATARALLRSLRMLNVKVIAYDPYISKSEADELGVTMVPLAELFSSSDIVSIHTPVFPETTDMITGAHIASMKQNATLINTARGEVVRENEMIEVLLRRPDLQAVLDVTLIEPPEKNSPLYVLPNVLLTPHIAGSVGNECRRMGRYMVEELRRYLAGEPLQWLITRDRAQNTCHRPVTVSIHAKRPVRKSAKVH